MIDLKTRIVQIAGSTPNPDGVWMAQVARQLTDADDGFLRDHRVLFCDRDTKFAGPWKRTLEREGIEIVATPYRAPERLGGLPRSFGRQAA
ncbi:MAG: hypothetical protein KDC14_02920 [Planctomycetes bacterium]|nr:hypothetical protein [Planctomycetota bacterium]MCB9609491.1 hypothetical protein [Polyangiaceae bacterium]